MSNSKKSKRVLLRVKDLDEEQLDAAIDDALDALFGKDEEEKPEKLVRVGKKVIGKPKNDEEYKKARQMRGRKATARTSFWSASGADRRDLDVQVETTVRQVIPAKESDGFNMRNTTTEE